MSLGQRIGRLETTEYERELWREASRIAERLQLDPQELLTEARRLAGRLDELQAAGLTQEEAERVWAEEEGMDPDRLEAEVQRLLSGIP